jgi:hypothetical protein
MSMSGIPARYPQFCSPCKLNPVVRSIKVGVVEKKMKWLRSDFIVRDAKTSIEATCDYCITSEQSHACSHV